NRLLHSFPTRRSSDLRFPEGFEGTQMCLPRSCNPSGSRPSNRPRLRRTISTSRNCCCFDRSHSISTTNGERVKKSVRSNPKSRRSEEHTSELQSRGHL